MFRIGFAMIALLLAAGCSNDKKEKGAEPRAATGFDYASFSSGFPNVNLPYQLNDSTLKKSNDTALIRTPDFAGMIPDSLSRTVFPKGTKVKYIGLASIKVSKDLQYFVVKGKGGERQAAWLLAFTKGAAGGVVPFLIPDEDPSTVQVSAIDKANAIIRSVSQKRPDNTVAEGREVLSYDAPARQFRMVLVNALDNGSAAILNPIDSFARTRPFTGDYVKDKKNFVSIRDGRTPNELRMFIHIESGEDEETACSGELRGDLVLISPTAAVFRKSGDPCVMNFRFTANSVTVAEEQGCGAHRELTCSFNGSYPLKKTAKPKPPVRKKKS